MGFITKEIFFGFLAGIFATATGLFLYLEYFSNYEFTDALNLIKKERIYGKVISLAAISNLLVFFAYLKKNQDYRARGVLIATILIALFTFALKFM